MSGHVSVKATIVKNIVVVQLAEADEHAKRAAYDNHARVCRSRVSEKEPVFLYADDIVAPAERWQLCIVCNMTCAPARMDRATAFSFASEDAAMEFVADLQDAVTALDAEAEAVAQGKSRRQARAAAIKAKAKADPAVVTVTIA